MKKLINRQILARFRKAIKDYEMIIEGDRLAVGVSGGKDSMVLLLLLHLLKKEAPFQFDFTAITLDLGQGADWQPLRDFCQKENIPLHLEQTQISEIVFDVRKEKNPCSLCANLRRGALNNVALELNCNKVALGHHLDDVVETFFMNLLFAGKMGSFSPSTFLSRTGITLIRPMVYLTQEAVLSIAQKCQLPIIHNPCPVSGETNRQEMRELVDSLAQDYPQIRESLLTALQNIDFHNMWQQREE